MTCSTCTDYAKYVEIRTPDALRGSIALAASGLNSGALVERKTPVKAYENNIPFVALANGGSWDDGLEYHFACTGCGQEFALHAETYHGAGGAWSRVEDLPWYGKASVMAKAPRPRFLAVFIAASAVVIAVLIYYVKRPG
jgi:hypothetical protein